MKFEGKKLKIASVMVGIVILGGGIALFVHYYPRLVPAATTKPPSPPADVSKDTGPTNSPGPQDNLGIGEISVIDSKTTPGNKKPKKINIGEVAVIESRRGNNTFYRQGTQNQYL